ncbi:divalent-cation tolerance protein CutA [Pseudodesulfovibrio sp. zrk46]|uniref:divalent-cation tolerance protein CutA n=1 Tax=Pseudodesulfovibrio sp. zrk46 TaxID=2725288 RepID=UPI00144930FD|nr:divalent-cation tolerance protein CutA [Pseudodesulfovibrio sp. zrk46]QJB57596.1 divalent-cation tolerance protein CutA [Pseudodesulfovibrio sp. zrk46]
MTKMFVYMTCETEKEAECIGTVLVERRLAACINIIYGMKTMYWWEGKVETANEVVLIAKTKSSLVGELTEAVKAIHSYDVPCIAALPIQGGNPDFLAWIVQETK